MSREEAEARLDLIINCKLRLDSAQKDSSKDGVEFVSDSSNEWVQVYSGIEILAAALDQELEKKIGASRVHRSFYYRGFQVVQVD